jgi:guanylate kinase
MTQVLPTQSSATTNESLPSGRLIILTGPSGVGKGTLLERLRERHPKLYFSISVTTRSPRPDEIDGKDYYFVSRNDFEQLVANSELLEWAEFAGNYYGTPREAVEREISLGKWVLLEIELEGARKIHKIFPNALRIFIQPPSLKELEQRLRDRGKDSKEAIARRLRRAEEEIKAAGEFDFQITNDNIEAALKQLEDILFT